MRLGFGFRFSDLYDYEGLLRIDRCYREYLTEHYSEEGKSGSVVALAPIFEAFLVELFQIQDSVRDYSLIYQQINAIFSCKRLFIQRRAIKEHATTNWDDYHPEIRSEIEFAQEVQSWLLTPDKYVNEINEALKYGAWATLSAAGKKAHYDSVLFKTPRKLDFDNLITGDNHKTYRDGFSLTDKGPSLIQAIDQANYCIFCHNQGKDSCSKGMQNKDGPSKFKLNHFGEQMTGCPLGEKISEMNMLKSKGHILAPLAVAIIDNPMIAATGHRICNDCMKACIYQKQEPVNIPKVETRVLNDVLDLPWGFEIYSLLTKWNPLNFTDPIIKPSTGYKILVAGLGPAGFTLSHYLLNEGHDVVAIDGLKIEPQLAELSGVTADGKRVEFLPIKDVKTLYEDLDKRIASGFGGVAEYGITVRWNKNYLKIIRLLLERRRNFRMYGGVRFGSNIDYQTAKELGFDHVALAVGAGSPNIIKASGALAGGVRMASDFLMALQLTGAARENSVANLQIRLPILVIGGGLTAIDTATESMAYYVRQVEKFARDYPVYAAELNLTAKEAMLAEEYLAHSKLFAQERALAEKEARKPNFAPLIQKLGGVNVIYRKKMTDAPSYRLNHEELELALAEGIGFIANIDPSEIIVDESGDTIGLRAKSGEYLPAHNIFIAAGTAPNIMASKEDPAHFVLDGKYFRAIDEEGNQITLERLCKPDHTHILTNLGEENVGISFFGDMHPSYAGNVVKAMASAKNGYKQITRHLLRRKPNKKAIFAKLDQLLIAKIVKIDRLTPTIIEIIINAPLAAQKFQPGQFYKLQTYAAFAKNFATESIALTGAWVDKERGLISTIVLEMGGSTNLLASLVVGEQIIFMGPTGHPTKITANIDVMLVGGGLGNAVLFSIAKAFKEAVSRVLYFAGYKKVEDRYKIAEIEEYADEVVWCVDHGSFIAGRPQDKCYNGNIVNAIAAYAKGELGPTSFELKNIKEIIAIGSDQMMAAVKMARNSILRPYLSQEHQAVASINSPMQCMMKEVCAQCLQRHVDPITGLESYVYSCTNQDQNMDQVDFKHLALRLGQNSLFEKLIAGVIKKI